MDQIGEIVKEKEQNILLSTTDPIAQGGFTQVPNFILVKSDLSIGAKVIYSMFLRYAWHNDSCFPGQERLAKDMGIAERSVRTYIQELEKHDLLEVKRRGQGRTNLYKISFVVQKKRKKGG